MPKYFLLILISAFFFISSLLFPAVAQQTPLERAQSDYNFQFTTYRDSQDEYTKAKATYLSFKTAVSKNDAFVATKDYLIQIDQLYLAFIALTEEHGNTINWSKSTISKDETTKTLKEEKTYLADHKQKVQNTKTLEELPPLADELEAHIKNPLELKVNKTLASFEVVEAETVFEEFNSLSRILDRIVLFKLRAGETKSILANWASEVKDIRDKTTEKLNGAKDQLANHQQSTINSGDLDRITDMSQEAKDELKRSKPLFEELIRIL